MTVAAAEASTRVEEASRLLALGWRLLPLGAKEPHYAALKASYGHARWDHLREHRASLLEVQTWVEAGADLGVILGAPSGGLVALDVDRRQPPEGLRYPPTAVARSRRGWHVYFRAPEEFHAAGFRLMLRPWGELRGQGFYVRAPDGSDERHWTIHPADHPPADLDELVLPRGALGSEYSQADSKGRAAVDLGGRVLPPKARADLDPRLTSERVARVLPLLGIPAEAVDGRRVPCPLPGCGGSRDGAVVSPRFAVHHRHWRKRGGPEWLALPDVYVSRMAGEVLPRLSGPSLALWWARLWFDAGVDVVEVPRLPGAAGLPERERRLARGFELMLALRAGHLDGPAPYSGDFAAVWCGMHQRTAYLGIARLRELGILRQVGQRGRLRYFASLTLIS